ncbi:MAG: SUMF1/EgtB/PvdO family nonheme iron enzyme [Candidatus Accumulibacter sp.]|uniref:SUMF1/EgtB/PvdO family nonheme iron enzyme n=1 Tax=Candidatus Accumulibacter proximus TaxID=2954385 RepID=A0A935Q2B1_9PROT|nr:SUMF1/EgtB/PvdO family nonheme iron enzyme [Candidatus Accumulibacter proximus]
MSWLQPTAFEQDLVADLRRRSPEVAPLAALLSLATRVEPLLLRNARLHFLPGSATEIESQLWFSPLVGARSSSEVIFHAGAARLLADELHGDDALFGQVIEFTRRHTRHWLPEERLEQDLRLDALRDNQAAVRQGLQDLLKRLHDENDEEQRIRLARWSRRCLATVSDPHNPAAEAQLLSQFATCSLGASSVLAPGSAPQPLPEWLAGKLPAPFRPARLAVELRYDAAQQRQVLHLIAPNQDGPAIDLPTSLPANLHVQGDGGGGAWHIVSLDSRVELPAATRRVLLTTIDGRPYELRTELPDSPPSEDARVLPPLTLSHLAEDQAEAREIAEWLRKQGLGVILRQEGTSEVEPAPAAAAGEPARLLRVWTHAAQRRAARSGSDGLAAGTREALLRIDPAVEPPAAGYGAGKLLDLPDWRNAGQTTQAAGFVAQLHDWLVDEAPASGEEAPVAPSEVERLLAELDDPQTPPPRRLEIGDRLNEIGDPRPGVGVRELVVEEPLPASEETIGEAVKSLPESDRLLAELDQPATIPPRRLAIGDGLAEIGDPRQGVGLDSRGLPEIDWVGIPGGEFIYQDGERRSLASFRMARYPVTNAQFQAFVDAGGYGNAKRGPWQKVRAVGQTDEWWQDLKRPEPQPSRWPQANRPRTNIDWYEAVAYCRWLSAQLGHEVRLPTEEEWERAARGVEGREYPWGKAYESGRANIDETFGNTGQWYLEQPTAVGVYPHGASSEGVLDLSGNVWEWCLNKYDRPDQIQADTSGDTRVLRGGSWRDDADGARGSLRYRYYPVARPNRTGFRLVSSAPIA